MSDPQVTRHAVTRLDGAQREIGEDSVAVERALEIRVDGRAVAVTLRTPGYDRELALGFLAGEGLLSRAADVQGVVELIADCSDRPDAVEIALSPGVVFDWSRLERHFAATSACGLCGRAHLESLRAGLARLPIGSLLDAGQVSGLPERLGRAQVAFQATGGLHAAAFCQTPTEVVLVREDVGRHNAVDKVIGWMLAHRGLPAQQGLLWVSGRAGAELVLKAARAGIPTLAAIGAPSSLAIEIAEAAGMTLIGFLRDARMNVYCGAERLAS